MTSIHQKLQILESLNLLDPTQAAKVQDYISNLMHKSPDEVTYQKFKRDAMNEIRQALGQTRKLNTTF